MRDFSPIGDEPVLEGESDLGRLLVIGERGSFGWVRPEHMEPTGVPSSAEVRVLLHRQLGECLILLERIGGVGALCRVTMTVNDLGKIDLYQWLYFLAQRAAAPGPTRGGRGGVRGGSYKIGGGGLGVRQGMIAWRGTSRWL